MRRQCVTIATVALLVGGCTTAGSSRAHRTVATRPRPAVTGPLPTHAPQIPSGSYNLSDLERDLAARGKTPRTLSVETHSLLGAPARTICTTHETLRIFEYHSANERAASSTGIDPGGRLEAPQH